MASIILKIINADKPTFKNKKATVRSRETRPNAAKDLLKFCRCKQNAELLLCKISVEYCAHHAFGKTVGVLRAVVFKPRHGHVEQHTRIDIRSVTIKLGMLVVKHSDKALVEIIQIQMLQTGFFQQLQRLLALLKKLENVFGY